MSDELLQQVENGNIDNVRRLLDDGADPNYLVASDGDTPLRLAAQGGHIEIIKLLLEKGAQVNLSNQVEQRTPLRAAAGYNQTQAAILLVSIGAEVNCPDCGNYTPLFWSAYFGNYDLAKYLIDNGADISIKSIDGHTALTIAQTEITDELKKENPEIVKGRQRIVELISKKTGSSCVSIDPTLSTKEYSKRVLDKILEVLVMVVVAVLVLDVLWQVFTRFILKDPSSWTEELATFLLIWVALLGAAVALGRGAHLGIDYFVGKLPEKTRIKTEIFVFLCIAAFSLLVMVVGGIDLVRTTMSLEQISPALGLNMGYVYLAVPISGCFLVLYSLLGLAERVGSAQKGGDA